MTNQKIALITGSYRGLGFQTAKDLIQQGWKVVVTSRKEKEGKEAVNQLGEKASFLLLDVANEKSIAEGAKDFGKIEDHLDLLINNAAIFPDGDNSIQAISGDFFEKTFKTNTIGPILVTQAFYPFLKKSKDARVINVSSGLGSIAETTGYAPSYSLSKAALNMATRQFSTAYEKDGIAVNSVCPGWCRTEMGGANATRSPEEGAQSILWLALKAPKNLTGKFYRDGKEINW